MPNGILQLQIIVNFVVLRRDRVEMAHPHKIHPKVQNLHISM